MWRYEKDGSLFVLVDSYGRIHQKSEEVSFLFQEMDGSGIIMHKYGSLDFCVKVKQEYESKGLGEMKIITSRNWKVESLNRILDTTGYLEIVLKNSPAHFEENDPYQMPK